MHIWTCLRDIVSGAALVFFYSFLVISSITVYEQLLKIVFFLWCPLFSAIFRVLCNISITRYIVLRKFPTKMYTYPATCDDNPVIPYLLLDTTLVCTVVCSAWLELLLKSLKSLTYQNSMSEVLSWSYNFHIRLLRVTRRERQTLI